MTMLRAIEVTRGYNFGTKEPDRNVFYGTRFDLEENTVKVWDEDRLIYLHHGFVGYVRDLGDKDEYVSRVTQIYEMQTRMNTEMLRAHQDYMDNLKVADG